MSSYDAADTATRVLVLNSGSSSLKYQLLDMRNGSRLAVGMVERIGEKTSRLVHTLPESGGDSSDGDSSGGDSSGGDGGRERTGRFADHAKALEAVADELAHDGIGLDSPELAAIGHRVVHGGLGFSEPTLIDDGVLAEIERLVPLAPLHNPANLLGIRTARALRPDLPQVAVFDTAFHTTMPEYAARYAIDTATADAHRIRRYGFHGTSHAYVSRRTAELLGKDPSEVNVIVLHLGNGASASAVAGGRCVDTSMGLTPLEGLVMGTRSGDIDPAVTFHLRRVAGMSVDEIDELLNKKSGLVGLCGDNDMREIRRMYRRGGRAGPARVRHLHPPAEEVHRCLQRGPRPGGRGGLHGGRGGERGGGEGGRRGGSGGIGPGHGREAQRRTFREPRIVSPDGARTVVAVVPTDEELEIARQTFALIGEDRPAIA